MYHNTHVIAYYEPSATKWNKHNPMGTSSFLKEYKLLVPHFIALSVTNVRQSVF